MVYKAVAWLALALPLAAGEWDSRVGVRFEQRVRYESRTGNAFGAAPDIETGLARTRLGLSYTPVNWLKLSGMVQDTRAPWYGPHAPASVSDGADLHEAFLELFPGKTGFGMTAGRMMLHYGEGRLLGTPQWGNCSRTYDHARVYYRLPKARFELLFAAPVKLRAGEFNRPAFADRIWGIYNSFPDVYGKNLLEVYALRRIAPGVHVNAFGFRAAGPLGHGLKYSAEAAGETQSAAAWSGSLSRRFTPGGRPLDISAEYKYASGGFDQLFAAYHDSFGHQDLFGWRNIHHARSLNTLGVTRKVALNFMYSNFWLADARQALYNGSGKAIVRAAAGSAGRHVGQEADVFATCKWRHFVFGAGYGHFVAGEFIRKTTPRAGPGYLYIFHTYAF